MPLFLKPFSAIYRTAVKTRLRAYQSGIFKKYSLPGFVLSIGNITTGGTGKTPAVMMLASWARGIGLKVAVLSRGYGGRYKAEVFEVSDGDSILATPSEAGDEPFLLANNLKDIPVILSKRRFLAGSFAREKHGTEFFILDDGFQHVQLERDMDLVLMDSADPFGNGRLLPGGPLREPLESLSRADVIIFTRSGGNLKAGEAERFINTEFPEKPVFYADHVPGQVCFPLLKEVYENEFLKGKKVAAFAGIARPKLFEETLLRLGADIVHFREFPDHHTYSREEIISLDEKRKGMGAMFLLTTEKDWARISSLSSQLSDIAYLTVLFSITKGENDIFSLILDSVNSKLGLKQ